MHMRNLLRISLASLAIACADPTEPDLPNGAWSAANTWGGQVVITDDPNSPRWPSDQVTINSAQVTGDSLELNVSYGGGCSEHTFILLSASAWMESYPVQVAVKLSHDAHDDACDAYFTRVLRFDLTPLSVAYATSYQTTTGIIRLNIAGSTTSPTYAW
jgi:hypothetical protein